MPSRNRLFVPITLKQFFTPLLLRISSIRNPDPGAAISICDVTAESVLGYDSLQVQLADLHKIKPSTSRLPVPPNSTQSFSTRQLRPRPGQRTGVWLTPFDIPIFHTTNLHCSSPSSEAPLLSELLTYLPKNRRLGFAGNEV
jgi:hypothetical protein